MGVGGQRHTPGRFTPPPTRKNRYAMYLEAGWVWTGEENLAPTGIGSQDRPTRSESLCQLNHRGPLQKVQLL